jgi:hypothetical protein
MRVVRKLALKTKSNRICQIKCYDPRQRYYASVGTVLWGLP